MRIKIVWLSISVLQGGMQIQAQKQNVQALIHDNRIRCIIKKCRYGTFLLSVYRKKLAFLKKVE